jgi:hypothetical protein
MTPAEHTDARWHEIELQMWALANRDEYWRKQGQLGFAAACGYARTQLDKERAKLWTEALELLRAS